VALADVGRCGRRVRALLRFRLRADSTACGGPDEHLLDLGCGGGKNAFNLKREFDVTGLDLSPAMIAQARSLNPECTFVRGDMRTFRLDRSFDAVLVDDAISHMCRRDDLVAAFRAAAAHLKPGGVLIATPDVTAETFQQNRTVVTPATRAATPDGLEVVFVENSYDPDPMDEQFDATILYLIRDHGRLRIETDHWTMGLFPLDAWRAVLRAAGLTVLEERYVAGADGYTVFACVKPA
jgi:SAM-dependent methyltransferase